MKNNKNYYASFSIEQNVKDDQLAAQEQCSKCDILRDMYKSYRFHRTLDAIQAEGRIIAARLGLEAEDDVTVTITENLTKGYQLLQKVLDWRPLRGSREDERIRRRLAWYVFLCSLPGEYVRLLSGPSILKS